MAPRDLSREIRCVDVAFRHFRYAVAHLAFAGRATCGDASPFWTRNKIRAWLDDLDDDKIDWLVAELEREATAIPDRIRQRRYDRRRFKSRSKARARRRSVAV